jgi:hypothetical protein
MIIYDYCSVKLFDDNMLYTMLRYCWLLWHIYDYNIYVVLLFAFCIYVNYPCPCATWTGMDKKLYVRVSVACRSSGFVSLRKWPEIGSGIAYVRVH